MPRCSLSVIVDQQNLFAAACQLARQIHRDGRLAAASFQVQDGDNGRRTVPGIARYLEQPPSSLASKLRDVLSCH
jgi:hypothetical protein